MPGPHRRGVLPRRRRRDDEGEDESSAAGDLDELSMSEGSAISHGDDEADVEGSEVSVDDEDVRTTAAQPKIPDSLSGNRAAATSNSKSEADGPTATQTKAGTLINGHIHEDSTASDGAQQDQADEPANGVTERASASAPQLSQQQETQVERAKREHNDYIRQRNSNPAFVPNRGGFFLHDDRSLASSSPYGRPFPRGRGRGYNVGPGVGRGFGQPMTGATDRQWAHDLHESVNKTTAPVPAKEVPASFQIPTAKPASVAPNRTFSISTVLGNVSVQVFLPGMDSKKTFSSIVKKQHTLLPQHRPPLRRDKPVRISIPDEEPRYIFPSTERSFIFIPRAMRPNQQIYNRGRGRGGYPGSRRTSVMGSVYTPSIAMSRKSSLGGAPSTGIHTPTDSAMPRPPIMPTFTRPIVRMPVVPSAPSGLPFPANQMTMPLGASLSAEQSMPGSMMFHSPTVALPMHQPRPQKAVSVAEIESPAMKAPQQQQEQPFHQQMPPGVSLVDGPKLHQAQPQQNLALNPQLSHIPEGAVYAQPFQPYPIYPQGGYYGPAFPGGPMVYHNPADPYGMGMGGPVLPPQFVPSQNFVPASQAGEPAGQPGAMAHEANGVVYYYDPSQYHRDGSHMNQYPMTVGGGMAGVPAPGPYFYPAMPGNMFYPTTQ